MGFCREGLVPVLEDGPADGGGLPGVEPHPSGPEFFSFASRTPPPTHTPTAPPPHPYTGSTEGSVIRSKQQFSVQR